jgi:hypothetical protein
MHHIMFEAASRRFLSICCIFTVLFVFTNLRAQTTDVPHTISYQGQITASDGKAMNGTHTITATLYSDFIGKKSVWSGSYEAEIKNGIFNISLGSGKSKLPNAIDLNRHLWLGIKIDESPEMPLTPLTAVPYALNVADKSITYEKLSDDLKLSMFSTKDHTPTVDSAGSNLYWSEAGNFATNPTFDYLGTSDNQPLIIKVNNTQVVKYIVTAGTPSIKGGYSGNSVPGGVVGGTISGGGGWNNGSVVTVNSTTSSFATVGGGSGNAAGSGGNTHKEWQTIGGGVGNVASGDDATVAGGEYHTASGDESAIGGGSSNSATANRSGVFCGYRNRAQASGAFVGGGEDTADYNNSANGVNSAITGGKNNVIITGANFSAIGGGLIDTITGVASAIPGGNYLKIDGHSFGFNGQTSSTLMDLSAQTQIAVFDDVTLLLGNEDSTARSLRFYSPTHSKSLSAPYSSFKAGLQSATIEYRLPLSAGTSGQALVTDGSNNLSWATISGGGGLTLKWYAESGATPVVSPLATGIGAISHGENVSAKADYSAIGGGNTNTIDTLSDYSVIDGGDSNTISRNSDHAAIGGGKSNTIDSISAYSVITGGENNTIYEFSNNSFLGGGHYNRINSPYSIIIGGDSNLIDFGIPPSYSIIGGGLGNVIESGGRLNVLVGGLRNHNGGDTSFMGGGWNNRIHDNCVHNAIVGGVNNFIGDPFHNWPSAASIQHSFVGGGEKDSVGSSWSSVTAGYDNYIGINAEYSFLGGGYLNRIDSSSIYSVLGGGYKDTIYGKYGVIAGGDSNAIRSRLNGHGTSDGCAIGGGQNNFVNVVDSTLIGGSYASGYVVPQYATVAGGRDNCVYGHYASVTGGWHNFAPGAFSTILGGQFLEAGDYQTVTGRCNLTTANLTFNLNNWKSSNRLPFNSPPGSTKGQRFASGNYWTFIVGNGSFDSTALPSTVLNRSNAFMVADTGYSMVTNANGSGGATVVSGRAMMKGGTYTDNVIDAWAIVMWNDTLATKFQVLKDFGCSSITRTGGPGVYTVTLNLIDPLTGSTYTMQNGAASVTVTLMDLGHSTTDCVSVMVTPNTGNTFTIKLKDIATCTTAVDHSLTFHVTGR